MLGLWFSPMKGKRQRFLWSICKSRSISYSCTIFSPTCVGNTALHRLLMSLDWHAYLVWFPFSNVTVHLVTNFAVHSCFLKFFRLKFQAHIGNRWRSTHFWALPLLFASTQKGMGGNTNIEFEAEIQRRITKNWMFQRLYFLKRGMCLRHIWFGPTKRERQQFPWYICKSTSISYSCAIFWPTFVGSTVLHGVECLSIYMLVWSCFPLVT